jgi:hypothetical protein
MLENGIPTAAYPRLKEIEFGGEDFNPSANGTD